MDTTPFGYPLLRHVDINIPHIYSTYMIEVRIIIHQHQKDS